MYLYWFFLPLMIISRSFCLNNINIISTIQPPYLLYSRICSWEIPKSQKMYEGNNLIQYFKQT